MGRPGTSHSSHSSHSSHRSSSHRSSSHRVSSSSSRPGTRHSSSNSHGYSYSGSHHSHNHYYGGGYSRSGGSSIGSAVSTAVILIVIFMMMVVYTKAYVGFTSPKSTISREKLTGVKAYTTDCIQDDTGWIESKSQTAKGIKAFYDKTGIQPRIYMKAYDSSLTTDKQKEDWAGDYFDETFGTNDLLFIYFAEKSDDEVGLMHLVYGTDAATIMDSEACDIFWAYMDKNWVDGSLSMTEVFTKTFTLTGNTIMTVSKTGSDVAVTFIIGIVAIIGLVAVIIFVKAFFRNKREQRESDERILNTTINPIPNSGADDLINRYNGGGSNGSSNS